MDAKTEAETSETTSDTEGKIPPLVHILCGWPLVLVKFGGAIGGGLGAVAYGINIETYKSNLSIPIKIALNILVGCAAGAIWLAIVSAIQSSRE